MALYHMGLQQPDLLAWLEAEWPRHTAARLDLGKVCLRLRDLDDIPYALVGSLAARMTPADWIEAYHRLVPGAAATGTRARKPGAPSGAAASWPARSGARPARRRKES